MCNLFVLFFFSDTNTLRPCNTDIIGASHHFPQPAAPQDPIVALPFWRLLTSVHPTPVPPKSHPVHPSHLSHPDSNQPAHKIQCFLRRSSRYDTIQPTIRYDPSSPPIRKNHPRPILSCLTASASRFYSTFPADAPSSNFSPSPAASAARHFLSSSSAASSTAFFASDLDSAIPKANILAFLIAIPTGQYL